MMGSQYVAIDGPLLSQRLPAFVQIDLRLDHAWRRSWGTLGLYIDVQNATNRDNPEGVTYNKDYSQRSCTTACRCSRRSASSTSRSAPASRVTTGP